jgi:hypothetical protein
MRAARGATEHAEAVAVLHAVDPNHAAPPEFCILRIGAEAFVLFLTDALM